MQTHEFKLLIIDDEPNIRSGLLKGLQPLCLQTHSAENAEEGINLFRAHRHDMVITDMRLPGTLDGLDILRAIREESPETQVIVITAYATIETAVDAMRLGAFDFITKPLDLGMIRHQVNKAVEHLRLVNE
ncbi:MAG: response regulator, partial [Limisphaerales bacterium]